MENNVSSSMGEHLNVVRDRTIILAFRACFVYAIKDDF